MSGVASLMKEEIRHFIEKHIDLIEAGRFKTVYEELRNLSVLYVGEFTKTLLDAGIDPAKYMNELPEGYLASMNYTSYKIPENITFIGGSAFAYTRLKSVVIPKKVEHLNPHVFENCVDLEKVVLPDDLMSIGDYAFFGCLRLTDIEIPSKVVWIGDKVFYGCNNLSFIKFQGTKQQWSKIRKEDSWRNVSAIEEIRCSDGIIDLRSH